MSAPTPTRAKALGTLAGRWPRWQAMHGSIVKVAILATTFAAGLFAADVRADDPPPPPSATESESRSIFIFQVENDVFNRFSPTDRDYTNGVRIGWLSPALTAMPPGIVALTTLPTFFGEPQSDSVVRRVGVSFGQNIYTPSRHLHVAADLQRPALCGVALCQLRPAIHLQAARREDGQAGAGAARHAAARPRPDRPGGRRRVRAEQFPQLIGVARPTAGPTSCTTSRRSASASSDAGAPPARS